MKPLIERGTCELVIQETEETFKVTVTVERLSFKRRKIRPTHGNHMAGMRLIHFGGEGGRRTMVPFGSHLQSAFLDWISRCITLCDVVGQPLTVTGIFDDNGVSRSYTPDFLIEIDPLPADLERMGFKRYTFVEVKPEQYADNWDVQLKLKLLELATGFAVVLITERDLTIGVLDELENPHVH
jgi:hypothetical protein